jgi:FtsP/CotA-like multicopper oxidase with cupredoxin domain
MMMVEERRGVREADRRREPTRRAFLQGAALGVTAVAGSRAGRALAAPQTPAYVPRPNAAQYTLRVAPASISPNAAQPVPAVLLNGTLPGPEIRVREGDLLRIVVENQLPDSPTSIHWHGVLVPAGMDGVPDISNAPIASRQMYVYEYPIRQSGTYWYHSHEGFQEQMGCYGAFIIEPAEEPLKADRDAVVILGDWLQRNPEEVFAELRRAAGPDGAAKGEGGESGGMKMGAAPGGAKMDGAPAADMKMGRGGTGDRKMDGAGSGQGKMAAGAADLADVKYDAFLLNGRSSSAPWSLAVRPGERVRLRLINGGGSTYFRLRLDDHRLQITHADGLAVEPVTVDHLLMGMGETYDALVEIAGRGSYTLHAVAQDGSGQALGVLHTADVKPEPNRKMPAFDGRALSYADLRAPAATTLPDGPAKSFRLPLQGDMARYVWMIDGQAWPKADPLRIRSGDRVQIEMVNQTMMWHPMHLHGHFFRVLQGAGDRSPLKHTVNVAPKETLKIEFTADNPGNWFFHCHNVYHLEAGMARKFEYTS